MWGYTRGISKSNNWAFFYLWQTAICYARLYFPTCSPNKDWTFVPLQLKCHVCSISSAGNKLRRMPVSFAGLFDGCLRHSAVMAATWAALSSLISIQHWSTRRGSVFLSTPERDEGEEWCDWNTFYGLSDSTLSKGSKFILLLMFYWEFQHFIQITLWRCRVWRVKDLEVCYFFFPPKRQE